MSFFSDIEKKLNTLAEDIDRKLSGDGDSSDPETAAIKAEIDGYSAAVSKDIVELGKAAFARFESGETPDEASAPIYERIRANRAAAEEAEARLVKLDEDRKAAELLKKERICPKCGKVCPPGMSFCGYCGSSLADAIPVEKPAPVEEAAEAPAEPAAAVPVVAEPEAVEAPVVEPEAPAERVAIVDEPEHAPAPAPAAPVAPTGKTCPRCGASVADGLKFCRECGAKIDAAPATAPAPAPAPAYKICPGCGAQLSPDKKFCSKCGTKQN